MKSFSKLSYLKCPNDCLSVQTKPVNQENIPSTSRASDHNEVVELAEVNKVIYLWENLPKIILKKFFETNLQCSNHCLSVQAKPVVKPKLGPEGLPVVEELSNKKNGNQLDTALSRAYAAMFGPMVDRNSYPRALKKYPTFIRQWLRFKQFRSSKMLTVSDIKDEYRGHSLQQLKRDTLIDIYRSYDSIDKLKFLDESEQLKLSLPTSEEMLNSANQFKSLLSATYLLMKICAQGGKPGRSLETLNWSTLNLVEIKSRSADMNQSMTKSERAQFVYEGYKHLNVPIADDFVDRLCRLTLCGLTKMQKKLMLRCDRCEEVKSGVRFQKNSSNKVVDLKLCKECVEAFGPISLHQQIVEIDNKSAEDVQSGSEQALESLRFLSEDFLNEIEFPVSNRCAVYTLTVNEPNKSYYDYAGFTSSGQDQRIRCHVALVEAFRRFNLTGGSRYNKYSVWAQQLEKGAVISAKTVFEGCNPAFGLLMETLCFQLTDFQFNLETDSNILPERFQPSDEEYFYLLKAIEERLEMAQAKEFTREQTPLLNFEPLNKVYDLDEGFKDFRGLDKMIHGYIKSIWKDYD